MSWLVTYYDRLARSGRAVETPRHSSCGALEPMSRKHQTVGAPALGCDRGPQLLLGCSGAAAHDGLPGRVVLPVEDPPTQQDHLPPDLRHAEITW